MRWSHRHHRRTFTALGFLLGISLACNLGQARQAQGTAAPQATTTELSPTVTGSAAATDIGVPPTQTVAPASPTLPPTAASTNPPLPTEPSPNPYLTMNTYYSFESVNLGGFFIRHQDFLGELTLVANALDNADATFQIIPGLGDANCISFLSYNIHGAFLRHQDFRIKLSGPDGTQLFNNDATFCPKLPLLNAVAVSFEAYKLPGFYLRHRDFHLYLEAGSDEQFRSDATFFIHAPLAP